MEQKCIGRFSIKSVTISNNLCKTTTTVFDNGVILIRILIMSEETEIDTFTKITTKFGKSLFLKVIGFKYATFMTIANTVQQVLIDNNINQNQILR